MTMRSISTTTICTCWMSLVERVMRDAVENLSISVLEKDMTVLNTSPLRLMPSWAAVREASRPTRMAVTAISREMPSILPPVERR